MDLERRSCRACESGVGLLEEGAEDAYLAQVPGWTVDRSGTHQIAREFTFADFVAAIAFVNRVAELAEAEGHHPNLLVHSWNKVKVELFTHAVGGLTENDFILAAKIDRLPAG